MKGKMKAQLFFGPGQVRYAETDIPQVGQGELLVRIRAALTCGSDLKTYKQGHPTMIKDGSVFGHEYAGDIVEIGPGTEGFKVGDRVVGLNSSPCFQCYYCRRERYSMCENIVYNNGAYAQYIKIPSSIVKINTFKIPDHVSYKEAALLEPLSCVLHGVEESHIGIGDTVAINGAGPIGLLFVALAKLKGARIIVSDLSSERLAYARQFGAHFTVDASQTDPVEEVKSFTERGYGADVAIDATGSAKVWEKAILMVRKGGLALLFGGCKHGSTIEVDTSLLHYSELTIKGIYHLTPYYAQKAFGMIVSGLIDAQKFITADMPLGQLLQALNLMDNKQGIKYNIVS